MKHERQLTARQEWEQYSHDFQQAVNETLAELTSDIEAANLIVAESYVQDPSQAREYALGALEHFNNEWPYFEEQFLVTGQWHNPEISMGDNGLLVKEKEEEAFRAAQSVGFAIYEPDDENEAPKIGLSFAVKRIKMKSAFLSMNTDVLSFAELDKISLQYLRPGNLDVVSSDLGEVSDALHRADALVRLYTTHANSEFYRVSGRRQQQMVDSVIQSIEETLPTPESRDLLTVKAVTPLIYLQNYNGTPLASLTAKTDQSLEISGTILGITTVDKAELASGQIQSKYTSPEECGLAQYGLSLIIHPDEVNFDLPDYNGNFIIPIRRADELELELV